MNGAAPDWSRDGKTLVFSSLNESFDLFTLPAGSRTPEPFLQTRFDEGRPAFSPDGRWIAYDSNASGRTEVYVRPFPASADNRQLRVSDRGGFEPRWKGDGGELFFVGLDGMMMAAMVDLGNNARRPPQALFPAGIARDTTLHTYAVADDGKSFLLKVPLPLERAATPPMTVVLNWPALPRK